MWQDVLADAGVAVETVDADRVRLRAEGGDEVLRLRRVNRPLAPSQIPSSPHGPALLALPDATKHAVAVAVGRGWNVVTDSGRLSLRLGAGSFHSEEAPAIVRERGRRGPPPWATYTVVRRLLADSPTGQIALGQRAGVSQPKVSRVLRTLANEALVERTRSGWWPTNWDRLFDWWLASYPGPHGVTSYWHSLDDPTTQARAALEALGSPAVVSGDVAADQLAPWRRPSIATIYVRVGTPLGPAGFVSVSSAVEATLALCAPKDPGVWLPTAWVEGGIPLADPLQVTFDLANGVGGDRDDAAAHLRKALRTTHRARWRAAASGIGP